MIQDPRPRAQSARLKRNDTELKIEGSILKTKDTRAKAKIPELKI
jgi:hypothetical protein